MREKYGRYLKDLITWNPAKNTIRILIEEIQITGLQLVQIEAVPVMRTHMHAPYVLIGGKGQFEAGSSNKVLRG